MTRQRRRAAGDAALRASLASLGERLTKARAAAGMTYDELAEASGVSKTYLWQLEKDHSRRASADILARIAAALGLTLADLLGEDLACLGGASEACAIIEHLANYDDLTRILKATFQRALELMKGDE